jgi:hypothetical protein
MSTIHWINRCARYTRVVWCDRARVSVPSAIPTRSVRRWSASRCGARRATTSRACSSSSARVRCVCLWVCVRACDCVRVRMCAVAEDAACAHGASQSADMSVPSTDAGMRARAICCCCEAHVCVCDRLLTMQLAQQINNKLDSLCAFALISRARGAAVRNTHNQECWKTRNCRSIVALKHQQMKPVVVVAFDAV